MSASTSESRFSSPFDMPYKILKGKSNDFSYWKHRLEKQKVKLKKGAAYAENSYLLNHNNRKIIYS
jgi:hypothetical protein